MDVDGTMFLVVHRADLLWIVALVSATVGACLLRFYLMLVRVLKGTDDLVEKHSMEDPPGFGTTALKENMAHILRVTRYQARLNYWQAEKLTNEVPPPLDID